MDRRRIEARAARAARAGSRREGLVLPRLEDRRDWLSRQAREKQLPKSYIYNEITGLRDTARFVFDRTVLEFKLRDYSSPALRSREKGWQGSPRRRRGKSSSFFDFSYD
jgi:hypothetical protein